jgi:hypothetical protein
MTTQSRRTFVKSSVLAGVGLGVPDVAANELFVHHVYFFLKNPDSAADKARLLEGLEKMAKIPSIKLAHIGYPAKTNRDVIERGYSVSWLCFFDSPQEEEAYQKHPIHDDFRNNYASLWSKVIVYDSIGPKR